MADHRLNHSRYLGNSGKYFGNAMNDQRLVPTAKQTKFFRALCAMCRENGIHVDEHPRDRVDYMESIERLKNLLTEKGIEIKSGRPEFEVEIASTYDNKERDNIKVAYVDPAAPVTDAGPTTEPKKFDKPAKPQDALQAKLDAAPIKKGDIYYSIVRDYKKNAVANTFHVEAVKLDNVMMRADGSYMIDIGSQTYTVSAKNSELPDKISTLRKKDPFAGGYDSSMYPAFYKSEAVAEKVARKLQKLNWK